MPKSDIEIAREANMLPIAEIGAKLGIPADAIMHSGPDKAKVSFDFLDGLQDRPGKCPSISSTACRTVPTAS